MNDMTGMQIFFAVVGAIAPFVSVQAASLLAQRREARQEAMKLFVQVHQDIQKFRNTVIEFHAHGTTLARLDGSLSATWGETRDSLRESRDELNRDLKSYYRKMHGLVNRLRSHCLAVGLIFDKQGNEMGLALTRLYEVATIELGKIDAEKIEAELLNPLVLDVEQQMKPLWNSFGSWKATD